MNLLGVVQGQIAGELPLDVTITINTDGALNMLAKFTADYRPPIAGDIVQFVIVGGTAAAPMLTDVWPAGVTLKLENNSFEVVGYGGDGGDGIDFSTPDPAGNGGHALVCAYPIEIDNTNGRFAGGGGGGRGTDDDSAGDYAGGGGGQGRGISTGGQGVDENSTGEDGDINGPGGGGFTDNFLSAGSGGVLGGAGGPYGQLPGGNAGSAISGISFVTFVPGGMGVLTGPLT